MAQAHSLSQALPHRGWGVPSDVLILHLMSAFPPLIESFVLREVRQLRDEGWRVAVAGLRPLDSRSRAKGFEDLDQYVSPVTWVSADMLAGILFFLLRRPRQIWECLKLISNSAGQPVWLVKMFYTLLSSLRFAYRFRNSSVGMVRAHFLHTEALGARFMNRLTGLPYSVTTYTVHVHYPKKVIQDILHNAAILFADTFQTKEFLEGLGAKPETIHVVHNSVRIQDYPCRLRLNFQPRPQVLAVGRLIPKKGFDVLLNACSVLCKRGVRFDCTVVGDGQERERLLEQRRCLGLEERVKFIGKLDFEAVRQQYYEASIFVMPSIVAADGETDGLPTVVVEAIASGLPVVGTYTGGIADAVREGVNGFLVPADAPDAIADRLQVLIESQQLCETFGRNSRTIAEAEFDLKAKGEVISRILRHKLESAGHATTSLTNVEAAHLS